MRYSLACLSVTGAVREHNEDNFAFFGQVMPIEHQGSKVYSTEVTQSVPFAVGVFDGMGGETAGEAASFAAAQSLARNADRDEWSTKDLLELFIDMEEAVCGERNRRRIRTMGTTATLLAVHDGHAYIANIGDSPAIMVNHGAVKVLSHAHTDAETLQLLGITDRKPGLTQFLGMSDGSVTPSPYIAEFDLKSGYSILLASDGLTGFVTEAEIASILSSSTDTSAKAARLRNRALDSGSTDNITVLLCEVSDSARQTKDVAL